MRDPESICIGQLLQRTGGKREQSRPYHFGGAVLFFLPIPHVQKCRGPCFFGGLQWTCHGFSHFHDPLSEVWADGTSEAKDLLGVAWARTIFWWMRLSHTFTRIVCLFRKSFLDTENEHHHIYCKRWMFGCRWCPCFWAPSPCEPKPWLSRQRCSHRIAEWCGEIYSRARPKRASGWCIAILVCRAFDFSVDLVRGTE